MECNATDAFRGPVGIRFFFGWLCGIRQVGHVFNRLKHVLQVSALLHCLHLGFPFFALHTQHSINTSLIFLSVSKIVRNPSMLK